MVRYDTIASISNHHQEITLIVKSFPESYLLNETKIFLLACCHGLCVVVWNQQIQGHVVGFLFDETPSCYYRRRI